MVVLAGTRWSPKGSLWLTNLRMVFVADQSDPGSGLRAFDIPLVYITADRFNQPIFVCNNLTGEGCGRICRLFEVCCFAHGPLCR